MKNGNSKREMRIKLQFKIQQKIILFFSTGTLQGEKGTTNDHAFTTFY